MVPLTALWLPILVAAVLVFLASSIAHMVLPHHHTDFQRVPREDEAMTALRPFNIPPGDYQMPSPVTPGRPSPEFQDKMNKGPVVMMTVLPNGPSPMTRSLALWFVYCVVVGVFAGYVAGIALPPAAAYLTVFRFTGTVAFVGYTLAQWQDVIWYSRSVTTGLKSTADGLVYALLTGGAFGWLWPA